MDSFIVAGIFQKSHEAHLYKTKLEAAGIQAFVEFENSAGDGFLEAGGSSGIQVKILKSDLEKANSLIKEFQTENDDYVRHLRSENILYEGKTYMPWEGFCENCDHDKIYIAKNGNLLITILIIMSLGLLAIFLLKTPKKLCTNCGHQWKD